MFGDNDDGASKIGPVSASLLLRGGSNAERGALSQPTLQVVEKEERKG